MSLRKTIEVVAKLAERGAIHRYAIAGAVAALNYIEPSLTEDLDILISVEDFERRESGLILLAPLEKALAELGYSDHRPRDNDRGMARALESAVEVELGFAEDPPLDARCLRAEHVVAIAIKLGRLKDLARVQSFLEQNAVDLGLLKEVLRRHGLMGDWLRFCVKAEIENPLAAI